MSYIDDKGNFVGTGSLVPQGGSSSAPAYTPPTSPTPAAASNAQTGAAQPSQGNASPPNPISYDPTYARAGITPDVWNKLGTLDLTNPNDTAYFNAVMGSVNTSLQSANTLIDQKNAVVQAMLGSPVSAEKLAKLPPDIQSMIQSGNRDALMLQASALNEQIRGYDNGVAGSLNFMTTGYQKAVDQAEKNRTEAISTFLDMSKNFVLPPTPANVANGTAGTVDTTRMKAALQQLAPGANLDGLMSALQGLMPVSEYNKQFFQGVNTTTTANQTGPAASLASAIMSQEGGSYTTVNPDSGALGKYQIMPAHLSDVMNPTTQKPLDPNNPQDVQLFLNTPALQDQLYQQILGGIQTKYPDSIDEQIAAYYGGDEGAQKVGTPAGDVPQGKYPSINSYVLQVKQKMDMASFLTSPSAPSDSIANKKDPATGYTANTIYQDALDYMFTGKSIQSYVGGLSNSGTAAKAKEAIANKASAIAAAAGITFPQAQALYKANAGAAKQVVERVARIESISQSLVAQFPRLAQLADEVKASGLDVTESDLQAGAAQVSRKFGSGPAAQYIELVQTVRGDYGGMQAALVGSRGGRFFAANAVDAVPLGLTGQQYKDIAETINVSATNALNATQEEMNTLVSQYGQGGGPASGAGGQQTVYLQNTKTGEVRSFSSMSPKDLQDAADAGFVQVSQ